MNIFLSGPPQSHPRPFTDMVLFRRLTSRCTQLSYCSVPGRAQTYPRLIIPVLRRLSASPAPASEDLQTCTYSLDVPKTPYPKTQHAVHPPPHCQSLCAPHLIILAPLHLDVGQPPPSSLCPIHCPISYLPQPAPGSTTRSLARGASQITATPEL